MQATIIGNKKFKSITLEIVIESQGELNVLKALSNFPLGCLHRELNLHTTNSLAEDHVLSVLCTLGDTLDDLGK